MIGRLLSTTTQRTLAPYVRSVCVHLYALAGYDARVASEFLFSSRQKRGALEFSLTVLDSVIVDWFVSWPTDALHELVEPEQDGPKRAHRVAVKFFEQHELGQWVAEQNVVQGLAPRTSAVATQYERIRDLTGSADGLGQAHRRLNLGLTKNKMFFRDGVGDMLSRSVGFQCRGIWRRRRNMQRSQNLTVPLLRRPPTQSCPNNVPPKHIRAVPTGLAQSHAQTCYRAV